MLYDHILNSDQRFKTATQTADKTGSAYSGWAPEEKHSSWWLVVIGLVLVALALWGLK